MKLKDCVLIAAVLLVSAVGYFLIPKSSADLAKISVDGKIFAVVSLSVDQEIQIGETNTAEILNGCIFMKSANCPDKLCIHQGKISDSSKKIVCLPNKVIIEVFSEGNADTVAK